MSFGSSTLIVIISKSRRPNFRIVVTSSGNSARQGGHQVAQTLNRRTFFVPFSRSFFTPSESILSRSTGVASHFCVLAEFADFFIIHFVEQPCGLVTSTGTGLPASIAS